MPCVVETDSTYACCLHQLLRLTPKLVCLERVAELVKDDVARVLIDRV